MRSPPYATYDWLVFTSANAVGAFANRSEMARLSGPPQNRVSHALAVSSRKDGVLLGSATVLPHVATMPRTAAIGPATAQALTDIGLIPDLVPPQAIAESLAQVLVPHIARGQTRILLIRAEAGRDILPDRLRTAGAHLTIAPAYRNIVPQESIPLLQKLFRTPDNWPDAITFTSSSAATNLLTLLEAAALELPPDGVHDRTILRASIGPITSQTLRDLGYPPHLEAPQATISALAETLAHRLHSSLSTAKNPDAF